MYSPTNKPTRRKFLERSALGAGSLLFAPLLLDSCTDHRIPDPDPNPNPGPKPNPKLLGDTKIDWNDDAKGIVTTGLAYIPGVGILLSGLVGIFWPNTKEDVWGEVRAQVESLVELKIGEDVYNNVKKSLGSPCASDDPTCLPNGLFGSVSTYLGYLQTGTNQEKLQAWNGACEDFVGALNFFTADSYQTQLLPLLAQYVNLYLALLRDGAVYGESWGRTPEDTDATKKLLTKSISYFTSYTADIYGRYRAYLQNSTPVDNMKMEPWITVNKFDRLMALLVLDYADAWPYYDVTVYPNGAINPDNTPINFRKREIYSDPMGIINFTYYPNAIPAIAIPSPPTQRPIEIIPQSGQYFSSIQVVYPAGGGPDQVTHTPRLGVTDDPNYLRTYDNLTDNPIIRVATSYDRFVHHVQFTFNDETTTEILGSPSTPGSQYAIWGFDYQALSSIFINSYYYDSDKAAEAMDKSRAAVEFIIYGFQYWKTPAETVRALRTIYITSPKEHSMAELGKAAPKQAIPADLITEDLKTARKKHWESIHANAHK